MTEILGLNLLEFVVYAWFLIIGVKLTLDNAPEYYGRAKDAFQAKFPKKTDPELTVELPVGSFDPDETMKLPRIKKGKQVVFVVKAPEALPRRRHAKK